MRWFAFLVLALGLGVTGCDETPDASNSFDVVRDQEALSYGSTRITLSEVAPDESRQVLWATNTSDPLPDYADDEQWDTLSVELDVDALVGLALDQAHPISGSGSWAAPSGDSITSRDVTFVGTEPHTPAIEHLFFGREWYGCGTEGGAHPGAQTMDGTLRVAARTASRLAGVVEVRVEGDVPCTDNDHRYFNLTLRFDLAPGQTWTDQVDPDLTKN